MATQGKCGGRVVMMVVTIVDVVVEGYIAAAALGLTGILNGFAADDGSRRKPRRSDHYSQFPPPTTTTTSLSSPYQSI